LGRGRGRGSPGGRGRDKPAGAAGGQAGPLVRRATVDDLPALGSLGTLLVEAHHAFDPARFLAATGRTPDGYAAFLRSQLDDPNVVLLVAEQEGRVAGYVYGALEGYDYMSLRGPAGVLHDLVVDPASRGAGVGRALLEAALEDLRSRGAPRVVLSTAERNEAAQRLFARLGFRRTMVEMTRELGDD
jgi:ribosomal protein S18 acetylase RimI-like enzyme